MTRGDAHSRTLDGIDERQWRSVRSGSVVQEKEEYMMKMGMKEKKKKVNMKPKLFYLLNADTTAHIVSILGSYLLDS